MIVRVNGVKEGTGEGRDQWTVKVERGFDQPGRHAPKHWLCHRTNVTVVPNGRETEGEYNIERDLRKTMSWKDV